MKGLENSHHHLEAIKKYLILGPGDFLITASLQNNAGPNRGVGKLWHGSDEAVAVMHQHASPFCIRKDLTQTDKELLPCV